MTCLNPKYVNFSWYTKINEKTGETYRTKRLNFKSPLEDITLETECIPCGKCSGCLCDKASDWASRAYLESQNHSKNAFITLTYNQDHINKQKSLIKADLQKFWKRLRKTLQPDRISYLACGEYGLKTLRPHYHACVFNYWPEDAKPYKKNNVGDMLFTSKSLEKIWGNGFVIVGQLTYESAAYVARYVFKKAYNGQKLSIEAGRTPEFTTASKNPAIAKNFYFEPAKWLKIIRNNGIIIPSKDGQIKLKPIPMYLRNKWKENAREDYYAWQETNKAFNLNNRIMQAKNTDKTLGWQQQMRREIKEKSLKRLDKPRNNNIELS